MENSSENKKVIKKFNKKSVQFPLFIVMLILPFLAYLAAQAGQQILGGILLGLMAIEMVVAIWMC